VSKQKHIINKAVLEVTVSNREQALSIQERVTRLVREKVNRALDELFSSLSEAEESIRIDHLVLDLGVISEKDLEKKMLEQILKKAYKEISTLIESGEHLQSRREGSVGLQQSALLHSQRIPIPSSKTDSGGVQRVSEQGDVLEQFVYFMRNGNFPWWHRTGPENQISVFLKQLLSLEHKAICQALVPELKNSIVRKRLLYQLTPDQLTILLGKVDNKLLVQFQQLIDRLFSVVSSVPFKVELNRTYGETLLRIFAQTGTTKSDAGRVKIFKGVVLQGIHGLSDNQSVMVLMELLRYTSQSADVSLTKSLKLAVVEIILDLIGDYRRRLLEDSSMPEEWKLILSDLMGWFTEKGVKVSLKEMERVKLILTEVCDDGTLSRIAKEYLKKEMEREATALQRVENDDGIYIENAGLVLIYPFLPFFFSGLRLLNENQQFISLRHAQKAVHLLQFIVSGQEETHEYELALNKLLCGLEVSEPVPLKSALSDNEKEECLHLVKTVLTRWEALKTENPQALRETFIQRQGILKRSGEGWNLAVERNAFDIMLEKLPWGISIIKLPWNEQILYVEW